ncbi:MAG: hypothetical protein HOL72_06405 [Euryarchaeota archaeon]|jgi:tetratricopeptide (TPR) repeat protein|nr:hypothetical protein [Euryarchaeota archaeon]MBT5255378.1 hypothetical protein [Euryarchaeota archaeon]
MSEINITQAPGNYISKWREQGPVDLETATIWRDEMGFVNWLNIAEAALFLDAAELLELITPQLSPAQEATFSLVRRRMLGDTHLLNSIEDALIICQDPETRDLVLEGRLRMEKGLICFEMGDMETAQDDLNWAEIRLKSVAKAGREHDLSLLNKAAFHMALGQQLMALQVYGDISRHEGHAHETIALSRIGASRIKASLGQMFDAARHAWNAHEHAIIAKQTGMALEAGSLFLELSLANQKMDAERMAVQVDNSKPRDLDEDEPVLEVNPVDVAGVFNWCVSQLPKETLGEDRPDIRALISIAAKLECIEDVELFSKLLDEPESVDDPMLAAICQAICKDEDKITKWASRLAQLTLMAE